MDTIVISDLAVSYRVGVTEAERKQPQPLLLTLQLGLDVRPASAGDDLRLTIDYADVCRRLLHFGQGRSWKLIETLAEDIAAMIQADFRPAQVSVEVKKFIIPEAKYVAVQINR